MTTALTRCWAKKLGVSCNPHPDTRCPGSVRILAVANKKDWRNPVE
ncbi:hypothetical protein Q6D67_19710 [Haliea sp. E1-2-M8]|nr:hypothetical protein [Haliea sp. E1-2-M8]MDO8863919.1 hypothetical protein [Haliea sp. E1-2-M8]